jgi:hypothetical protein
MTLIGRIFTDLKPFSVYYISENPLKSDLIRVQLPGFLCLLSFNRFKNWTS